MSPVIDHPAVLALLCVLILWLFTRLGTLLASRIPGDNAESPSSSLALAALFTLLGLLIGITLATAAARNTQRQLYEQQEATAIRSAYIRAQLLARPQALAVRSLLAQYLSRRIAAYNATIIPHAAARQTDPQDPQTSALPPRLWQVVFVPTPARRVPASSLVMESLNTALNTRGYAQRAWSARIPDTDWLLLTLIAALACLLAGFALAPPPGAPATRSRFLILIPTLIAASFFLIDDLDQPSTGLLRTHPQSLETLARDLPRLP